MLKIIVICCVACIANVNSYYIRLESPTSNSEQRLLLTPQLEETYRIHPQQIVPLYRFTYPNQQVLYYNPHTIQSSAELNSLNYNNFNRIVNAQPINLQNKQVNDESNEAVSIENLELKSPIQINNRYYVVNHEESPPVFYGNIDPQTGHPMSTVFSLQKLQSVVRDDNEMLHERKETSSMSPTAATTTMRIIVEDEKEEESTTTTESSNIEDLISREIALREKEQSEKGSSRQGSDESIASAKPSALALAGPGGVASSKPIGTALTGDYGLSVASPEGTAIAGDYGDFLSGEDDFIKDTKKTNRIIATSKIIQEYRKKIFT